MPNIMTQPRSRWGFANPSKGMIQYDVKQGHKQQLLQEAASLLPDYAKLSDELLKNEMHFVDGARVKNELDKYTSQYMDKYSQNPFYSFSREGRNLAKAMQSIVKNPMLQSLGQQYKKDQSRWDQADKDGVSTQYDVNEHGIKVRTADGRVVRKYKTEAGDNPFTIDDSYQYVHNVVGAAGGGFNYEMSSDKDLEDSITKAFMGMGDDKIARDNLEEGKRIVQSGNNRQVNARVAWLKQQGLSQADLNRIYAEYTKKAGKFDINEANKYVVNYVNNYAEGVRESSSDISYLDEVRKAGAGLGSGTDQLPTTYTSAIGGSEGKRTIALQTPSGSISIGEGNILTNDVFKDAPTVFREDGLQFKSHKVTDLDIFRKLVANNAYVPVATTDREKGLKAGALAEAPKSVYKNMVISETEPPSLQVMIKDQKGNPASADEVQRLNTIIAQRKVVPEELRKYFTVIDGQPELNRGYFLHGQGLVPRKRGGTFGFTSAEDKEASDYFTNLGHNSIDDDLTRQEYNEFSGKKDDITGPLIGFNDQVYKVDIFIPVNNTEIFMGDKIRGTKDALLFGEGTRMQNPNVPVDKGYLGLAPFNQVSNPNRFVNYPQ